MRNACPANAQRNPNEPAATPIATQGAHLLGTKNTTKGQIK